MALTQEYFDSIHIDVVKRKYYNANKVNAVFDEIREQAAELLAENERLRRELEEKAPVREEMRKKAESELLSVQQAYRLTLEKANTRADAIMIDAQARSRYMTEKAEKKAELAAQCVEECIRVLRDREEQNIAFLNARMHSFLSSLYDATKQDSSALDPSPLAGRAPTAPGKSEIGFSGEQELSAVDRSVRRSIDSGMDVPASDSPEYSEFESKISRLAKSIYEMEDR